MRKRPSHTSACFRRFAARESLTFRPTFGETAGAPCHELRNGQCFPDKSIGFVGGIAVDALVFEFMGLAMLALCVVVLAIPSRRPPARHISDY
jgi:hypothetical protein